MTNLKEASRYHYRPVTRQRSLFQASCTGEVNECQNGGTMIWDPDKLFACVCKDGYEGELCEGNAQSFSSYATRP